MKQTRFHGQFFTVPNLLSYLRLALIPVIVWLYCGLHSYTAAVWIMVLSAATDVADGIIARRCRLVTDWGKIIDPIADKLTQIAICLCLAWRYIPVRFMLVLLVAKEIYMGVIGLVFIHKTDSVEGAVWYGKMTTVLFFAVALLLVLFPEMPLPAVAVLVGIESASILLSMVLYTTRYLRLYHCHKERVQ